MAFVSMSPQTQPFGTLHYIFSSDEASFYRQIICAILKMWLRQKIRFYEIKTHKRYQLQFDAIFVFVDHPVQRYMRLNEALF